jgi:hypothetical protein
MSTRRADQEPAAPPPPQGGDGGSRAAPIPGWIKKIMHGTSSQNIPRIPVVTDAGFEDVPPPMFEYDEALGGLVATRNIPTGTVILSSPPMVSIHEDTDFAIFGGISHTAIRAAALLLRLVNKDKGTGRGPLSTPPLTKSVVREVVRYQAEDDLVSLQKLWLDWRGLPGEPNLQYSLVVTPKQAVDLTNSFTGWMVTEIRILVESGHIGRADKVLKAAEQFKNAADRVRGVLGWLQESLLTGAGVKNEDDAKIWAVLKQASPVALHLTDEDISRANLGALIVFSSVFNANFFSDERGGGGGDMYSTVSRILHSCNPNCTRLQLSETPTTPKSIVVISTRNIGVGDPITISYWSAFDTERQTAGMFKRLSPTTGGSVAFDCDCTDCKDPPKNVRDFQAVSKALLEMINDMIAILTGRVGQKELSNANKKVNENADILIQFLGEGKYEAHMYSLIPVMVTMMDSFEKNGRNIPSRVSTYMRALMARMPKETVAIFSRAGIAQT